ncbi:NADPH:quinone oxidoreductase family protein [Enemella sp. A6]|uniref:NADPH:quinone oxidoreductase family protein n=1 Tax=Enemella sp. A6 TaxID=3440152 RepID=UPI003EC0C511
MLAHVVTELGTPDRLQFTEVADPVPGPGQVLLATEAAGVNFPDGLLVAGTYQTKPELPFTPGSEAAGTILAVGDDVEGLSVGQRVVAFCRMGGYAEQVLAPAEMVYPLPDAVSALDAAAMPVAHGTSYHGLVDRARLQPGETLLVLGAAGGVGLTAVEIGHQLGARVIAAASSDDKLELARSYGADELIRYSDTDLGDAVKELTGGRGADVIYDPVGGDLADAAVRRLAVEGRYLSIGYASGTIPKVGMNRLLIKEGTLFGFQWGAWARRNPELQRHNMDVMLGWVAEGKLRPHIDRTWPLAEAAEALQYVLDRKARGKCMLTAGEENR